MLLRGSKFERSTDLWLDGPSFPWHHSRNYDSGDPNATTRESRWMGGKTNTRLYQGDGLGVTIETVVNAMRTFVDRGIPLTGQPQELTAPVDYPATLTVARQQDSRDLDNDGIFGELIDVYVLTEEETDIVLTFAGFSNNIAPDYRGRLIEESNRAYAATSLSGTRYTYGSNGEVATIITSQPQDYVIKYVYEEGTQRLERIDVFDGPSDDDTLVQQAIYTYASDEYPEVGAGDDLIQVVCRKITSNNTDYIERVKQYRYYQAGDVNGRAHQLKMVFEPDAVARAVAGLVVNAEVGFVEAAEELLRMTDNQVRQYVTKEVEYYTNNLTTEGNMITTRWGSEELQDRYGGNEYNEFNGDYGAVRSEMIGNCGGCGGGSSIGIRKYFYYLNLNNQATTNPNIVVRIVVEDTVGTDDTPQYRRLYGINYRGAAIRQVDLDDPLAEGDSLKAWCQSRTFNNNLRIVQERMPSAHSGVNSDPLIEKFLNPTAGALENAALGLAGGNDEQTVNSDSGVVYHYEYSGDHGDGIRRTGTLISDGLSGDKDYVSATDWGRGANDEPTHVKLATYIYRNQSLPDQAPDRNSGLKTSYRYDFWDTDDQSIKSIETLLPVIDADQNGSGVVTHTYRYYDRLGRMRWSQDGEGYIHYASYHSGFGTQAYLLRDVDPDAMPASRPSNPWLSARDDGDGDSTYEPTARPAERSETLPPPLALQAVRFFDNLGRTRATRDPNGNVHQVRYYNNATASFSYVRGQATLPIQLIETDNGDVVQSVSTLRPDAMTGRTTSIPALTDSDYVTRETMHYDPSDSRLVETRSFHDIEGGEYYSTHFLYDRLGRSSVSATEVESGKYQVDLIVRDDWDRTTKVRSGVMNSVPTDYDTLAGTDSALKTMQICTYDGGGTGDSHKTHVRVFHSDSEVTDQIRHFTYRGHLRGIERQYSDDFAGGAQENEQDSLTNPSTVTPILAVDVDWLGRPIASAGYTTTPSWDDFANGYTPYASSTTNGRFSLTKTDYDDQHRVYQVLRYPHKEARNHFEINRYYDRRGYLVAGGDKYSAHSELAYDGAGRLFQQRIVSNIKNSNAQPYDATSGQFLYNAPTPHPTFQSASGGNEGVIALTHSQYGNSADSMNMIARYDVELNNNDSNGIQLAGGNVTGGIRNTTFYWHDSADRVSDMANYGSSDGTATSASSWTHSNFKARPDSPPNWTEADVVGGHQLVSRYGYHPKTGRRETRAIGVRQIVAPQSQSSALETQTVKTFHDDLSRARFVVENWQSDFDPTTSIGNVTVGVNRLTESRFNGLNRTVEQIAYNTSNSTGNQSTQYLYGDPVSGARVTGIIYPDTADGNAQVIRAYNRGGALESITDQRGVTHTLSYNNRRQVELDAVTNVPASVDSEVQAIGRSYDTYGRVTKVTSYGTPSVSANIKNDIQYSYYNHGKLLRAYQAHAGPVSTSSSPNTSYLYDVSYTAGVYNDGLRHFRTYYPVVSSASMVQGFAPLLHDDRLHRPTYRQLDDGNLRTDGQAHKHRINYRYNGTGRLVRSYSSTANGFSIGAELRRYTSAGNYDALDQFGRPVKQRWFRGGTSYAHTERSYDYASNLLTRDDIHSQAQQGVDLDRAYTYDGLNRMQSSNESDVNNGRYWKLDQLGNQTEIFNNVNGNGNADQTRTYSTANELETSSATTFGAPEHDEAGNMTNMPFPNSVVFACPAKYDAWNRLASLHGDSTISYQYDGLHRRIQRVEFGATTHFYYNEKWQVLTETDGAGAASAIYSYNTDYVDSVAVRMRPNDEHFFTHDNQYSVTAAIDSSTGDVVERYRYSPRGQRTVMDENFVDKVGNRSDFGVEYAYTGARLDQTRLQLHRYRYYHPTLGQWINRDPAGYADGMNLYRAYFVPGMMDPSGLEILSGFDITNELNATYGLSSASIRAGGDFLHSSSTTPSGIVSAGGNLTAKSNDPKELTNSELESAIVFGLLSDKNTFVFAGNNKKEILANIKKHVDARISVVKAAKEAEKCMKWRQDNSGTDFPEVYHPDDHGTPQQYWNLVKNKEVQCNWGARYVMSAGGELFRRDASVFIPGDKCYFDHTTVADEVIDPLTDQTIQEGNSVTTGQNVIYLGGHLFWGHHPNERILTVNGWIKQDFGGNPAEFDMNKNNGKPIIHSFPEAGLDSVIRR